MLTDGETPLQKFALAGGGFGLALALAAWPAGAAVVTLTPDASIATTPYTITFQPGETLSFSNVSLTTTAFEAAIGVNTTGGAEVFSVGGAPDYFQTFATTNFPSDQLGVFAEYSTPTGIPYSVAEGLVGFEYTLADGIHYGVADVGGDSVFSYRLETTPGQSLGLSAVPEPATWAMLLVGLGLTGSILRRDRQRRGAQATA